MTAANEALTDLGFHTAEMRTLCGLIAEACARDDQETVHDLSAQLKPYLREFVKLYINLLVVSPPRHPGLYPIDTHDRMSV